MSNNFFVLFNVDRAWRSSLNVKHFTGLATAFTIYFIFKNQDFIQSDLYLSHKVGVLTSIFFNTRFCQSPSYIRLRKWIGCSVGGYVRGVCSKWWFHWLFSHVALSRALMRQMWHPTAPQLLLLTPPNETNCPPISLHISFVTSVSLPLGILRVKRL